MSTGCVSISKIETSHMPTQPQMTDFEPIVDIYIINKNQNRCITKEQKQLIYSSIKKYFSYEKSEKIEVYIEERLNISVLQATANIVITALTYTVIPAYYSTSFLIDIVFKKDNKPRYKSAVVTDESLISALAIPFIFHRSTRSVNRQNIENGFYIASQSIFTNSGNISMSHYAYTHAKECENSFRDKLKYQKW